MMKSLIAHCDFQESDIKPMQYAIEHFGCIPSVFILNTCVISPEVYESLLSSEFNGFVRREFDTDSESIFENFPSADKLADYLVGAVNVKPDFYKSYNDDCDKDTETVVLSVYFSDDTMDYVKAKKKKPLLTCRATIYYKSPAALKKFLEYVTESKHIVADKQKVINHNSYISLVTKSPNGSLDTTDFEIKNPKINIPLAYGQEFEQIDKNIFRTLTNSEKGLWVFHGPPGTGKSMYIRNLIRKMHKSQKFGSVIYMPSEMVAALESPDFIPFIQDYQDSVLVIEDADNALESRKNHGSIVKTVLQLTDGILADCLRLKIIATFNCELSKIDEALLRKGRLQIRHEFRYLNRDEAIKLAISLKINPDIFDSDDYRNKKDWTLAEIYNIHTDFHWEKKQKKLGF